VALITLRHERHAAPAGARPGDRPLYAIGDIHGCYDHLHALLAWVARDAGERSPGVAPVLVLLGDYVDRGPDSAKVLAALAWLARSSAITARRRWRSGRRNPLLAGEARDHRRRHSDPERLRRRAPPGGAVQLRRHLDALAGRHGTSGSLARAWLLGPGSAAACLHQTGASSCSA